MFSRALIIVLLFAVMAIAMFASLVTALPQRPFHASQKRELLKLRQGDTTLWDT